MVKTPEEYLEIHNAYLKEAVEHEGEEDPYSYPMTAEEVVGYYLAYYGEEAYETWMENLKDAPNKHDTDEEVTRILKALQGPSEQKRGE
ncbi:hypothetical protein IMZ31_22335 (plasmid) [Pontibacillus sp. ALD_SL1]|uniref:hypothetical protein n=1 Tax=Pontibacillus sp. ALD_SL1 TaxID=2777185 RepID=UPI001A965F87|nr:hypothetical protein [Pontibacillus sp. ALD_SL1]QST02194.1 hypothetical protein IMZ31_22335 [Pontibacillus sp. ALD_SL1]